MKYEATEEDYQKAELAAHKIAPLFQLFGWQWSEAIYKPGEFGPYRCGTKEWTPTVQQIADEFIRLIEDFQNNKSEALETGRLGIKRDEDGYQLYLTL